MPYRLTIHIMGIQRYQRTFAHLEDAEEAQEYQLRILGGPQISSKTIVEGNATIEVNVSTESVSSTIESVSERTG